jgi:hypothetical protein
MAEWLCETFGIMVFLDVHTPSNHFLWCAGKKFSSKMS